MFNKKDTALIQMAEAQQAALAINHLDKSKLWGKVIRVMHSKHTNVQVRETERERVLCFISSTHLNSCYSCQRTANLMQD